MNNSVPVRDSVYQWKTLYTKLSEGKLPNINEISLEYQPVDGLPASVTDLNGELEASKDAGNILPPKPEPIPIPESYKETVPVGTYGQANVSEMGRARGGSRKKRTTTSKRKRTGGKKRKGRVTKKRAKRTSKIKRAKITKR